MILPWLGELGHRFIKPFLFGPVVGDDLVSQGAAKLTPIEAFDSLNTIILSPFMKNPFENDSTRFHYHPCKEGPVKSAINNHKAQKDRGAH